MKKLFLAMLTFISTQAMAQTLEKMQWFNEPEQWEIADNALSMYVTPHSDYWRISHYGFTVDDAPFYYNTYGGEFEVKVKNHRRLQSPLRPSRSDAAYRQGKLYQDRY